MSQQNPIGDLVVFENTKLPSVGDSDEGKEKEDYLGEKDTSSPSLHAPSLKDGLIHGRTLVDGEWRDVSWTLEEQRRVVRKADFFLLPLFTVGQGERKLLICASLDSSGCRWTGEDRHKPLLTCQEQRIWGAHLDHHQGHGHYAK